MLLGMLDEQIDSVITDSIVPESDSVVFPISLLRESVSWKPFLPFDTLTNQVELVEEIRKSTRLNSSHVKRSRMPSSA